MTERLIEAALFLLPFLVFVAWRLLPASTLPSPALVLVSAGCTVAMLAWLLWLHQLEAANADRTYVPAQLHDGRIIPGHAVGR